MKYEIKKMTVEEAVTLGGREWQKGDHHRVYFNGEALYKLYGLEINCYNTGSISSVYLNGKKISNNKARGFINQIEMNNWMDAKTGEFRLIKFEG